MRVLRGRGPVLLVLILAASLDSPPESRAQALGSSLTLVGLAPCRLADTRGNGFAGPFGPPALGAGLPRDFPLAGQCGIPAQAQAVSLNATATGTLGPGFLLLAPAGAPPPLVSTLNYQGGDTVANAAVVPLGPAGLTVIAGVSGADLVLDVNGYFVDAATVCPPSMVRSGSLCVDTYEASVWETTDPAVVTKIRAGTVTLAELQAAGAVQHGATSADYAPGCPLTGNGCANFYAVSIAGVTPSRFITWFQAAAVARNARKRLLTNAEWQAAALGTPDGAPCLMAPAGLGPTGTPGCVSAVGAFDMVGNLNEWVADWVPQSTACVPPLFGTNDFNCLAGASTTAGPGALLRGGSIDTPTGGVFAISGQLPPSEAGFDLGFRGAR